MSIDQAIRVKSWLHHTPRREYRPIFHAVFSAGQIRIKRSFQLRSWLHPGHDLILCEDGIGRIQIGNRVFVARKGDLIWADNNRGDVSWPDRSEDWEFSWIRADSNHLDQVSELLNVRRLPVFQLSEPLVAKATFTRIITAMEIRPVTIDVILHALISNLIALAFEARISAGKDEPSELDSASKRMAMILERVREEYASQWRVKDLADLSGYSVPQFHRLFREATGATPVDWLRHERINHAKRRLAESTDPIQLIAEEVGYADALYFSRDFRKLSGQSPSDYRKAEYARRSDTA